MKTVDIIFQPPSRISIRPGPQPGGTVRPDDETYFRLPFTNTTTLTVLAGEHKIDQPTSVLITDRAGKVIWVDCSIDPITHSVSFSASKPLTGYLYIA